MEQQLLQQIELFKYILGIASGILLLAVALIGWFAAKTLDRIEGQSDKNDTQIKNASALIIKNKEETDRKIAYVNNTINDHHVYLKNFEENIKKSVDTLQKTVLDTSKATDKKLGDVSSNLVLLKVVAEKTIDLNKRVKELEDHGKVTRKN